MSKLIVTHNKTFHADEITAIALLKLFLNENIVVNRVDHDTKDFSVYDMVIDIGKKFDGKKHFDHHQYQGGKSSAGLIWDYLGLERKYPKISKLVDMIDKHDVGIKKAAPFEFPSLIKSFNNSALTSQLQDRQFNLAVEFTITILNSMKEMENSIDKAKGIIKDSFYFNSNPSILELSEFTPHWTTFINGKTMPHIKAVVWEDIDENTWKVEIAPKKLGSYDLNGKKLNPDDSMIFVHSAGHFAVAKNENIMKKFLQTMNI